MDPDGIHVETHGPDGGTPNHVVAGTSHFAPRTHPDAFAGFVPATAALAGPSRAA